MRAAGAKDTAMDRRQDEVASLAGMDGQNLAGPSHRRFAIVVASIMTATLGLSSQRAAALGACSGSVRPVLCRARPVGATKLPQPLLDSHAQLRPAAPLRRAPSVLPGRRSVLTVAQAAPASGSGELLDAVGAHKHGNGRCPRAY